LAEIESNFIFLFFISKINFGLKNNSRKSWNLN
jgi:hypothetical protein